jgi:hypothetical protein
MQSPVAAGDPDLFDAHQRRDLFYRNAAGFLRLFRGDTGAAPRLTGVT